MCKVCPVKVGRTPKRLPVQNKHRGCESCGERLPLGFGVGVCAACRAPRLKHAVEDVSVAPRANDGPRRKTSRAKSDSPLERLPGAEVLPKCAGCGAPCVWRGSWQCDTCLSRHALRSEYNGIELPRVLPPEALCGVPLSAGASPARVFSSGEGDNSSTGKNGLDELEALTSFSRRARAARLVARGAKPCADGSVVLNPWHGARAKSLAERGQRWRRCGELLFMAEGPGGRVVPVEYRCGDWRACPRCRSRRRYTARRDARKVRDLAVRLYRAEMSRYYTGEEKRHSEKLLTLTVPHSGDVNNDVALMRRAMPRFMRGLTDHVNALVGRPRKYGNLSAFPWYRVYEVAATNELHVHAHLWMLAPYLDHVTLRVMWGRALLREGLPPELMPYQEWGTDGHVLPWPVLDIRSAKGVDYAAKVGLTDYVAKNDGVKRALAPAHFAAAYEALSDLRVAQWAMGWCPREGAAGWLIRRASEEERAAWLATLQSNLARVASGRNDVANTVIDASFVSSVPATGPPETPKAPASLPGDVGANQLFLSWDSH